MEKREWETFQLYGRTLHVRYADDRWHLRLDEREVSAAHLDHAVAELLHVPSHMALKLALAILNGPPGSAIA